MIMRKVTAIILAIILAFSLVLPISSTSADGLTYRTPVKVKLLPSNPFSIQITGNYQITNLETNELIPAASSISFSLKDGKVILTANNLNYTSIAGFDVNELAGTANSLTISKIQPTEKVIVYRGKMTLKNETNQLVLYNTLDMEDYLRGVVPSEMPASWHMEALKAQTVAARSYAFNSMNGRGYLDATTASQVYGGKTNENARTNEAIDATNGIYAVYNGKVIDAYFHSSSGGHTEDSEKVWKNPLPYMRGVDDPYDQQSLNKHYNWTTSIPTSSIMAKLNQPADAVLVSLNISERSQAGSVQQMMAKIYTDGSFKSIPLRPTFISTPDSFRSGLGVSLKSIKFNLTPSQSAAKIMLADGTVTQTEHLYGYQMQKADGTKAAVLSENIQIRYQDDSQIYPSYPKSYTATGDGWGHRLGMSQYGAKGMADAGKTYDQILKHYYTGIQLEKR